MNWTAEEREQLKTICMPVVEYMKKNCTPHDTIVITDEQFKLVSDEISIPVSEYKCKNLLVEIQGEDIYPSNCLTEDISKKRPTFEDHIRANYHEAGKEKVAVEIGKLLNGFSMTEAKDILSMVSYELDKVAYIKTE